MKCVERAHLLSARAEPALHHVDLVLLRHVDPQRELLHVLGRGSRRHERGHLDRLRVVADHALHELDVGVDVLDVRQVGRRIGRDDAARLARRAGLNDRRPRIRLGTLSRRRAGGRTRPARRCRDCNRDQCRVTHVTHDF